MRAPLFPAARVPAASKIKALTACGAVVAPTPDLMGEALTEAVKKAGIYERCLINASK